MRYETHSLISCKLHIVKCFLPGNLTLVNIHSSLAEETSSSLRFLATEKTEEVEVRRLSGYLKVADSAVTL